MICPNWPTSPVICTSTGACRVGEPDRDDPQHAREHGGVAGADEHAREDADAHVGRERHDELPERHEHHAGGDDRSRAEAVEQQPDRDLHRAVDGELDDREHRQRRGIRVEPHRRVDAHRRERRAVRHREHVGGDAATPRSAHGRHDGADAAEEAAVSDGRSARVLPGSGDPGGARPRGSAAPRPQCCDAGRSRDWNGAHPDDRARRHHRAARRRESSMRRAQPHARAGGGRRRRDPPCRPGPALLREGRRFPGDRPRATPAGRRRAIFRAAVESSTRSGDTDHTAGGERGPQALESSCYTPCSWGGWPTSWAARSEWPFPADQRGRIRVAACGRDRPWRWDTIAATPDRRRERCRLVAFGRRHAARHARAQSADALPPSGLSRRLSPPGASDSAGGRRVGAASVPPRERSARADTAAHRTAPRAS